MYNQIYLDNAATKQTDLYCYQAVGNVLLDNWGNPSSLYSYGDKARLNMMHNREIIADFINAKPREIIFTSGGCEGNSLALLGFIRAHPNTTLITTPIEHKSIMLLAEDYDDVRYVEVQEWTGIVFMKHLEGLLKEVTEKGNIPLVSIHFANSEIGTIQDIKTITSLVHKYSGIMHTDATQMMCQEKIDVKELDVDMLSFSGQKMGAPKGIGVLYRKEKIKLKPLIYGSQEGGLRGGTENTAYIQALADLIKYRGNDIYFHNKEVRDYLGKLLSHSGLKFIIIGHPKMRLNNHLSICFIDTKENGIPIVHGESLLYLLDSKGIYVSTGSACNARSAEPSYVAQALKIPDKYQYSIVRFTFSNDNTKDEMDKVIQAIKESVNALKLM